MSPTAITRKYFDLNQLCLSLRVLDLQGILLHQGNVCLKDLLLQLNLSVTYFRQLLNVLR